MTESLAVSAGHSEEGGACDLERVGDAHSLAELTRRLLQFRDQRDWKQFHTAKNLMLSLALEAAELMEIAQWKTDEQLEAILSEPEVKARFEEECADVLLYLLLLCERVGIDLPAAAAAKIERNAERYPVERARGSSAKYDKLLK